MILRDKLKDVAYFDAFLSEEMERMNKFDLKLKNNEVNESQILPVQIKLHNLKLGVFIARYSKGEEIENLVPLYESLIDSWSIVWSADTYVKNLWLISLSNLLNLNPAKKHVIIDILEQFSIDDCLFNFILGRKNTSKSRLMLPEIYGNLYKAVDAPFNTAAFYIKDYVENTWYKAHKVCGWYDSHKSKQHLYCGYWSFEAAAIAKILEINASDMVGIPFYPYDLAHF